MIWPDIDHGHIWGFATLGIIIAILIYGAWKESQIKSKKPKVGDIVRVVGEQAIDNFEVGRVFEVHDDIDVWWDTAHGENKVALLDALDEYGDEKAATAEWYAMIENVEYPGETMAVASFEVERM